MSFKNLKVPFSRLPFFKILFLLLMHLGYLNMSAQVDEDTTQYVMIVTQDGQEYYGLLTLDSDTVVGIKDVENQLYTFRKEDISKLIPMDAKHRPPRLFQSYNYENYRYFTAPSGYNLKKGEAIYQNSLLFLNEVSYGFTDNFSAKGGVVYLPFIVGFGAILGFKVSQPIIDNKLNVGLGYTAIQLLGERYPLIGQAYFVTTLGSTERNITIGVTFVHAGEELAPTPSFNLSSIFKLDKRIYLLTENYYYPGEVGIFQTIAGARYFFKSNKVSLDGGASLTAELSHDPIIFPWLALKFYLGR